MTKCYRCTMTFERSERQTGARYRCPEKGCRTVFHESYDFPGPGVVKIWQTTDDVRRTQHLQATDVEHCSALAVMDALRRERTFRRIPQKELAKKLGVTPAWVSMCENMSRHPKLTMLSRWAKTLGYELKLQKE